LESSSWIRVSGALRLPAHWGYTRAQRQEEPMAQTVIEVVGSSKESFAKAAENAKNNY
jgi:hypothetical protein